MIKYSIDEIRKIGEEYKIQCNGIIPIPQSLEGIDFTIINKPWEIKPYNKSYKKYKKQVYVLDYKLKTNENAWKPKGISKTDTETITGLLNKITVQNEIDILEQIKELNYTDPKIVEVIFKKAVSEPFFSDLYARICYKLSKLHPLIREMCVDQFEKNKHKDMCSFIGELYKKKLIRINGFIKTLTNDELDIKDIENNVEILCTLIITVGVSRGCFNDTYTYLDNVKEILSSRYKFMIMDLHDYRSGKRKVVNNAKRN